MNNNKLLEILIDNIKYSIKPKYYYIDDEYNICKISACYLLELIYIYTKTEPNLTLDEYINEEKQNLYKIKNIEISKDNDINDKKIIKMIYNRNQNLVKVASKLYFDDSNKFFKIFDKFTNLMTNIDIKNKYYFLKKFLELVRNSDFKNNIKNNYSKLFIMQYIHFLVNCDLSVSKNEINYNEKIIRYLEKGE